MLACASDEPKSYAEGVADACHGACIGWQRCGLSGSGCEAACTDSYDPRGARPESLSAIGECLKTESCATLDSDKPFRPCFDKVRAAEPLREQLIAYCESAAASYFECNIWAPIEDCVHIMGTWSDDVLKAAARCFDHESCEAREACHTNVFENPP